MTNLSVLPLPEPGAEGRLVLYLSGRWDARCTREIGPNDVLYCAPGFSARAPGLDWYELPRVPRAGFADLARAYAEVIIPDDVEPRDHLVFALANTHFEYGVSPIAAQLEAIEALLEEKTFGRILVIASDTRLERVPAVGIVTKESSRGSADLLGALVARAVLAGVAERPHERILTRGDALSRPLVRAVVLRAGTIALATLAAIRLMRAPVRSCAQGDLSSEVVALVRSPGQAQHAARLLQGMQNASALIIPQFSNGNTIPAILKRGDNDPRILKPSNSDVWRALVALVFRRHVSFGAKWPNEGSLQIGRFRLAISLQDVANELRLVPALDFHKTLLERSIRRLAKVRRVFGFEIKGGFSAAEAMAGHAAGVATASIQTVLVPPRPLPMFPWSDVFHADSESSARQIEAIGQKRKGHVAFSGSPFAVTPITPPDALKTVLFLSQPYELAQARILLSALVAQARVQGFTIRIRLHPRDAAANYAELLAISADVLAVSDGQTLDADISAADLCLTRISSSAKEALAAGKPILICLMSEYDRTIVADYIATDVLAADYVAQGATDLERLLASPDRIVAASSRLQARIFGDKDLHDLRQTLSE